MTDKTKEELIEEIKLLKKRIAELETIDIERKQQREKELQKSEIKFRTLVEHIPKIVGRTIKELGLWVDLNDRVMPLP